MRVAAGDERPMIGEGGAVGNPLLEDRPLFLGKRFPEFLRRHLRFIMRFHPHEQFTLRGIARNDRGPSAGEF